ncbi:MAG TPA: SH3 domain-containing protein, partial [Wenzhouxiangella sp.]|nr:SH3 domain-containing protein [Wenzhouxiangella sp.]
VVVSASSLNVRSGPSGDSSVVYSLSSGNIVNVLARAGSWVQVEDDQGRSGWVSADHVIDIN